MLLADVLWIAIVLFLVHEMEEIMMIPAWTTRHARSTRGSIQNHTFMVRFRGKGASMLVFRVYLELLYGLSLVLVTVLFDEPVIFAGFLIIYALHLAFHIVETLRSRVYMPCVVTAALTLPGVVLIIGILISNMTLDNVVPRLLLSTAGLAITTGFVLRFIEYASVRAEAYLNRYTKIAN